MHLPCLGLAAVCTLCTHTIIMYYRITIYLQPDYDHMQDHEHAPRFKGESRGKQSKKGM